MRPRDEGSEATGASASETVYQGTNVTGIVIILSF